MKDLYRRARRWLRRRRWLPCWLVGCDFVIGTDYGVSNFVMTTYCPKCRLLETIREEIC